MNDKFDYKKLFTLNGLYGMYPDIKEQIKMEHKIKAMMWHTGLSREDAINKINEGLYSGDPYFEDFLEMIESYYDLENIISSQKGE